MARNGVRQGGNVLDMGSVETLTGDVLAVHQARSGLVALFGKERSARTGVLATLGQPVRQALLHGLLGDNRSTSGGRRI